MKSKFDKYIAQFLEDNQELINNNQFEELYDNAQTFMIANELQGYFKSNITKLLHKAGLEPLNYMSRIPMHFLNYDDNLTKLEIPKNVEKIGIGAFESNFNLKVVIFNEGLTSITTDAFHNCNINTVVLPKSIELIGTDAFSNNYLENVFYKGTVEEFERCVAIGQHSFDSLLTKIDKIHCSDGDYDLT